MNDGECGEPSEDNSDRWGVCHGNGSPTPSPPIEEVPSSLTTPPNESVDMDLDPAPSDEPAVRKRRVSERCDWFLAQEAPPPERQLDGAFSSAELREDDLQVSVALLQQDAHLPGRDQTPHPHKPPQVGLSRDPRPANPLTSQPTNQHSYKNPLTNHPDNSLTVLISCAESLNI